MDGIDQSRIFRDNRRICFLIEQYANRAFAGIGLTPAQAYILLYVLGHSKQGTSLTSIHREFGYSMATLSGMIKRLREKGYVRVEPCGDDDRRKMLFGTQAGFDVRAAVRRALNSVHREISAGFSPDELECFGRLQTKMLQTLSALAEKNPKEASKP